MSIKNSFVGVCMMLAFGASGAFADTNPLVSNSSKLFFAEQTLSAQLKAQGLVLTPGSVEISASYDPTPLPGKFAIDVVGFVYAAVHGTFQAKSSEYESLTFALSDSEGKVRSGEGLIYSYYLGNGSPERLRKVAAENPQTIETLENSEFLFAIGHDDPNFANLIDGQGHRFALQIKDLLY